MTETPKSNLCKSCTDSKSVYCSFKLAATNTVKDAINQAEESKGFMEDPPFAIRQQIVNLCRKAQPDCPYINYNPLSATQFAKELERQRQLESL